MGLQPGNLIKSNEVVDYLGDKDYHKEFYHKVNGKFFGGTTVTYNDYFWSRSNVSQYVRTAWDIGTTYTLGAEVSDDGKLWQSKQAGNTGNTPTEGTFWAYLWDEHINWGNFRYDVGPSFDLFADKDLTLTVYKITWDISGDEIETVVHTEFIRNTEIKIYLQLDPGYYKVKSYIGISSGSTNSYLKVTCNTKPWDNMMEPDSLIKIMDTEWKELQPVENEVTLTLARAGRLSSPDYEGGDYEIHVP